MGIYIYIYIHIYIYGYVERDIRGIGTQRSSPLFQHAGYVGCYAASFSSLCRRLLKVFWASGSGSKS